MSIARLLPLAVMAVAAACTGRAEPWMAADGAPPKVSEVSYCHEEGRRQASVRYPDQIRRDNGTAVHISDERRFPAEIRFYEQCMTRLGYVRTPAPAK